MATMVPAIPPPPVPVVHKPGHMPDVGLRRTMRKVLAEVDEIQKQLADKKAVPKEALSRIEAIKKVPHDPRWKEARLDNPRERLRRTQYDLY